MMTSTFLQEEVLYVSQCFLLEQIKPTELNPTFWIIKHAVLSDVTGL